MNTKKRFNLIAVSIACLLLIGIGKKLYDYRNQTRLKDEVAKRYEEYRSKVTRFPVQIKSGQYLSIGYSDMYLLDKEDGDKKFAKASKKIFIDEINTKYSEYVITNETNYIAINIEGEIRFIEYPISISNNYLKNLREFMRKVNDNSIHVFPFNDGVYCLIDTNEEQYIYNIELGKVVWTRGAYYESPRVNIFNDTLECGGDLSSDTYVFNKYGKLIETKKQ